jgi:hypothetical protein
VPFLGPNQREPARRKRLFGGRGDAVNAPVPANPPWRIPLVFGLAFIIQHLDRNAYALPQIVSERGWNDAGGKRCSAPSSSPSASPKRFLSAHDQIANLFDVPYPGRATTEDRRTEPNRALMMWREACGIAAVS